MSTNNRFSTCFGAPFLLYANWTTLAADDSNEFLWLSVLVGCDVMCLYQRRCICIYTYSRPSVSFNNKLLF